MTTIDTIYQRFLLSSGVCTDTRQLKENEVFFALQGDKFDANLMIDDALQKRPLSVITSNLRYNKHPLCIYVPDTLIALGNLAHMHRQRLKARVIGITGTNGKTTTKELMREALNTIGKVSATKGNLNNHIGVPLTILGISNDTEFAIIEMGANHIGEIDSLCKISDPNWGIITNIGKAHLEGFGSFEGVIRAKSELYLYLMAKNATIIINEDDALLSSLSNTNQLIPYSQHRFNVHDVVCDPYLSFHWEFAGTPYFLKSSMAGSYNINNFLAAIAVGLLFGGDPLKINTSLSNYCPSNNRSQWIDSARNSIVMDAYNANPSSMREALISFASLKGGKKMLILGDMLELGSASHDEHKAILELVKELKFSSVFLVGPVFSSLAASYTEFLFFYDATACYSQISDNEANGFVILIKGSRGMKLESLLSAL